MDKNYKDYREKKYQENCELIDMILDHRYAESITERVEQVVCEELEMNVVDFLSAYRDGDPDAMICALTGWNLETLMAKAKVIPDVQHQFYSEGEVPASDIDFPRYGKAEWTEQEFMDYLREKFTISVEALRLIQNAFGCARNVNATTKARQDFLWSMLQGTIGIEEEIVRKVVL